jgi:hypothetical protein
MTLMKMSKVRSQGKIFTVAVPLNGQQTSRTSSLLWGVNFLSIRNPQFSDKTVQYCGLAGEVGSRAAGVNGDCCN